MVSLAGMRADPGLERRAAGHAALGDPVRLSIVDELTASDRAPVELRRRLGIESNLLAHHLDVLERVGLIERSRSSGDGRRRYVHLRPNALGGLAEARHVEVGPALFVCSANSARSQLAVRALAGPHRAGRRIGGHPPGSPSPSRRHRSREAGRARPVGRHAPRLGPSSSRTGAGGDGVRPCARGARPGRRLAALVRP